jgi:hypothetical protein
MKENHRWWSTVESRAALPERGVVSMKDIIESDFANMRYWGRRREVADSSFCWCLRREFQIVMMLSVVTDLK